MDGYPHDDPIRQHVRAAGDGTEIPAGFTNDRGGFTGDGGFVYGSHAFDYFAVGRDRVTGLDQHDVFLAQGQTIGQLHLGIARSAGELLCQHIFFCAAQRCRLCLAAAFRQRFGKICKQYREPEPERYAEYESCRRFALPAQCLEKQNCRQNAADIDDEHHGVAPLCLRGEFSDRIQDCGPDQPGVKHPECRGFAHYRSLLIRSDPGQCTPVIIRCSITGPSASAGT